MKNHSAAVFVRPDSGFGRQLNWSWNGARAISVAALMFFSAESSARSQAGVQEAEWCWRSADQSFAQKGKQGGGNICSQAFATYPTETEHGVTRRAIVDACTWNEGSAIQNLHFCQCHNENARNNISNDSQQVLQWLRATGMSEGICTPSPPSPPPATPTSPSVFRPENNYQIIASTINVYAINPYNVMYSCLVEYDFSYKSFNEVFRLKARHMAVLKDSQVGNPQLISQSQGVYSDIAIIEGPLVECYLR